MHPEVESNLRERASNWVKSMSVGENHPFFLASKFGYISNEDLYYLGIVNAAGSIALDDIVEVENPPTTWNPEAQLLFVDQDSLEFKERESERQYHLVSQLYNCSPVEAEDRWERIIINIHKYMDKKNTG